MAAIIPFVRRPQYNLYDDRSMMCTTAAEQATLHYYYNTDIDISR